MLFTFIIVCAEFSTANEFVARSTMTDESEIDNEANGIDLNGTIENYPQPPLSKQPHG